MEEGDGQGVCPEAENRVENASANTQKPQGIGWILGRTHTGGGGIQKVGWSRGEWLYPSCLGFKTEEAMEGVEAEREEQQVSSEAGDGG